MHSRTEQEQGNSLDFGPGDTIEDQSFALLKNIDDELRSQLSGIGGLPEFRIMLVREVEPKPFVSVVFDGFWSPTVALPTNSYGLEVRYSESRGSEHSEPL